MSDDVDLVELNLRDALERSENSEVNYHIREALQKFTANEELPEMKETGR